MKKQIRYLLEIILILSVLTIFPYFLFGHNEPYETIPIGELNFCASRHDCDYYMLNVYDKKEGVEEGSVVIDLLQSVLYADNVIVVRCGTNGDFFVRYYFVTYDPNNPKDYHVCGPLTEKVCLDSLKNKDLDPKKMTIANFKNFSTLYLQE